MGHLVILIQAAGYRWACPECKEINLEATIPSQLVCQKCGATFKDMKPAHIFGNKTDQQPNETIGNSMTF